MNQLTQAYITLGLTPGAPFAQCQLRYKQLVLVRHPDRQPDNQRRRDLATCELKQLNHAYDLLKTHFTRGGAHSDAGDCLCRQDQPKLTCNHANDSAPAAINTKMRPADPAAPQICSSADTTADTSKTVDASRQPGSSQPTAQEGDSPDLSPGSRLTIAPKSIDGPSITHLSSEDARLRWRAARTLAVIVLVIYALAIILKNSTTTTPCNPTTGLPSNGLPYNGAPYQVPPGSPPSGGQPPIPPGLPLLGRSPFPGDNPGAPAPAVTGYGAATTAGATLTSGAGTTPGSYLNPGTADNTTSGPLSQTQYNHYYMTLHKK